MPGQPLEICWIACGWIPYWSLPWIPVGAVHSVANSNDWLIYLMRVVVDLVSILDDLAGTLVDVVWLLID